MDLNASAPVGAASKAASTGHSDKGLISEAASEAIFRRAADEEILWRGKPEPLRLAATAFHTNSMALYFAILTFIAFMTDGLGSAITVAVMGVIGVLILMGIAFLCARNSSYVLSNHRLVMLIGIAVEKRISVPLKQVKSADLRPRGSNHGDIALQLSGERKLGYFLLWPHARPLRFARPQPMMRCIPDAQSVAAMLANAAAELGEVESHLTHIKDSSADASHPQPPSGQSPELGGAPA